MFESTEQSVCNQARAIKRNGWLSELELETKNRQVEGESLGELSLLENFIFCAVS